MLALLSDLAFEQHAKKKKSIEKALDLTPRANCNSCIDDLSLYSKSSKYD